MGEIGVNWKEAMRHAVELYLNQPAVCATIDKEHIEHTPERVVETFEEYFWGTGQDPRVVLRKGFAAGSYDQMVVIAQIDFVSLCAHHLTPILGQVSFGYLPHCRIVGLSKIPRLVEILARRPQVQEKFTRELVDVFQQEVAPRGCGAMVEALHLCMMIRGVRKARALTKTVALSGEFLTNPSMKSEFLAQCKPSSGIWP